MVSISAIAGRIILFPPNINLFQNKLRWLKPVRTYYIHHIIDGDQELTIPLGHMFTSEDEVEKGGVMEAGLC